MQAPKKSIINYGWQFYKKTVLLQNKTTTK